MDAGNPLEKHGIIEEHSGCPLITGKHSGYKKLCETRREIKCFLSDAAILSKPSSIRRATGNSSNNDKPRVDQVTCLWSILQFTYIWYYGGLSSSSTEDNKIVCNILVVMGIH